MADDVSIRFVADVSNLQKGMQEANGAVQATTGALRSGAAQINSSFASLTQAYAANSKDRIGAAQSTGFAELSIARQNELGRYEILMNGLRIQNSSVREQAQTAQISRQQELSGLLALDAQREDIEQRHLGFLQSTYRQGTVGYASAQRQIMELASQSALRRREIERGVTQQIYNDYRRVFEQVGSSISSAVMGMIQGQMTLRQAMQRTALSIVESFVQARIKVVADWFAGVSAMTAATMQGEVTKTAAVTAGVGARTAAETKGAAASNAVTFDAAMKSITASASETFAGIFGFLSPVMGPAAAGPAAAGEATVLATAGVASFAVGAWSLPNDMVAQVHAGEMIIPAGPAAAFRSMMSNGGGVAGTLHVSHSTNFNISAMDARSVKQFLSDNSRQIMRAVNEGVRTGSHLGLSKLAGG